MSGKTISISILLLLLISMTYPAMLDMHKKSSVSNIAEVYLDKNAEIENIAREKYSGIISTGNHSVGTKHSSMRSPSDVYIEYMEVPNLMVVGQTYKLNASIYYTGDEAEINTMARWYINGTEEWSETLTIANNTANITTYDWTPAMTGLYFIKVSVDPIENETILYNNNATTIAYVGTLGMPNLTLVSIMHEDLDGDGYFSPGDVVYTYVTIRNDGDGSAVNIACKASCNYSHVLLVPPFLIRNMEPGDENVLNVTTYISNDAELGTIVHVVLNITYNDIQLSYNGTLIVEYDLQITHAPGVSIDEFETPPYGIIGDSVPLNVSFTYWGPDASASVIVSWIVNENLERTSTHDLSIGESATDTYIWTPISAGFYNITVIVAVQFSTYVDAAIDMIPAGYRVVYGPINPNPNNYQDYIYREVSTSDPSNYNDTMWVNISYGDYISSDTINATILYYLLDWGVSILDYCRVNTTDRYFEAFPSGTSGYWMYVVPKDLAYGDIVAYSNDYGLVLGTGTVNILGSQLSAYKIVVKDINETGIIWADQSSGVALNVSVFPIGATKYYVLLLMNSDMIIALDNIPPEILVLNPQNNSYTGSTSVVVSWEGHDNTGIDHYEIRIDGEDWINVGTSTSYTFLSLEKGRHYVDVKAYDLAQNVRVVEVIFTVDLDYPHVEIIAPEDEATVGNTFDIIWNANDSTSYIARVEVYLGSELVAVYLHNVNMTDHHKFTSIPPDKWYNIRIVVYDAASLQSHDDVDVYVVGEGVFIILPPNGSAFNRTWVEVRWSYGGEPDNFTIYVNGSKLVTLYPRQRSFNITDFTEGFWIITIVAKYSGGGVYEDSVSIYIDLTPPSISIVSPENGSYINSQNVSIQWIYSDDRSGVDDIEISVDGGEWIDIGVSSGYTVTNLDEGAHVIYIKVSDRAGNIYKVRLDIVVDLTPPTITIISPENNSIVKGNLTIKFNATDNFGIDHFEYKVDGGSWINIGDKTTIMLDLDAGEHTIKIKAVDKAGNEVVVTLIIEIQKPPVPKWLLALGIGIGAAIIGVILLYLMRKKKKRVPEESIEETPPQP